MEIQAATSVIHLEHVAGTARFVAAGVSSQIPVEDVEMNASDTPRIDVQTFTAKNVHHLDKSECHSVVTADFARTLERELNGARLAKENEGKDRDQWMKCATKLAEALNRSDAMLEGRGVGFLVLTRKSNIAALSEFIQLSQQQEGEGKK